MSCAVFLATFILSTPHLVSAGITSPSSGTQLTAGGTVNVSGFQNFNYIFPSGTYITGCRVQISWGSANTSHSGGYSGSYTPGTCSYSATVSVPGTTGDTSIWVYPYYTLNTGGAAYIGPESVPVSIVTSAPPPPPPDPPPSPPPVGSWEPTVQPICYEGPVAGPSTSDASPAVAVSWTSISGAQAYQVFRCEGENCTMGAGSLVLNNYLGNSWTDTSTGPGTTYRYQVRARMGDYWVSGDPMSNLSSNVITFDEDCSSPTPPPSYSEPPPTCGLSADPVNLPEGGGVTELSWWTQYANRARLNLGSDGGRIDVPLQGSMEVNISQTRQIVLNVYNNDGTGYCTRTIYIAVPPPQAFSGQAYCRAEWPSGPRYHLSWEPPDIDYGILSYQVIACYNSDCSSTVLPYLNWATYRDSSFGPQPVYYFFVRAIVAQGGTYTFSDWAGPLEMFKPACGGSSTATLTAANCQISVGSSSCQTEISWSFTGATNPRITNNDGSTQYYTGSSGAENRTLSYGTHIFVARDDDSTLASVFPNANCEPGTSWNSDTNQCEEPVEELSSLIICPSSGIALPLGSTVALEARYREFGEATCSDSLATEAADWSSTNANATVSDEPGSKGQVTGMATGTANIIATFGEVTADKDIQIIDSDIPDIVSLVALPPLVRQGDSTEIAWELSGQPAPGVCTLSGGGIDLDIFEQSGTTSIEAINSRIILTVACGGNSSSVTVNVIPVVREG